MGALAPIPIPTPVIVQRWLEIMKSIVEVLKQKEAELQQIQIEVEALRVAMRLMSEDGDGSARSLAPVGAPSESRKPHVEETSTGSNPTRQFP